MSSAQAIAKKIRPPKRVPVPKLQALLKPAAQVERRLLRYVTRKNWKNHKPPGEENSNKFATFWTITRVVPRKRGPALHTGKAWGIFVFKGKLRHNGEERRINRANKRGWRQIKMEETYPSLAYIAPSENYHRKMEALIKDQKQPPIPWIAPK